MIRLTIFVTSHAASKDVVMFQAPLLPGFHLILHPMLGHC